MHGRNRISKMITTVVQEIDLPIDSRVPKIGISGAWNQPKDGFKASSTRT